jgi:hypothetical protein
MEASADAQNWSPINGTEIEGDGAREGFNLNRPEATQRHYRFRAKSF